MSENVVWLNRGLQAAEVLHRIDSVVAVFTAIDAAELLSAVPESEAAQDAYWTALSLLELAERELLALRQLVAGATDNTRDRRLRPLSN